MRLIVMVIAGLGAFAVPPAIGAQSPLAEMKAMLAVCTEAALRAYPGELSAVELEVENDEPIFDLEIETEDGRTTEVECSAVTGEIRRVEWEDENIDLDAFLTQAKLSPALAREKALKAVPGRVIGVEMQVNSKGVMAYEFEIETPDGEEFEVEIDAMSGAVLEVGYDVFEIGQE
jgi:uncharacterized membrane protein YkoI